YPDAVEQFSRQGAVYALEAERHRPGASADVALRDRAAAGGGDGVEHVLPGDVAAADVVEVAVVGFADHRIDRTHVVVPGEGERVVDQRVRRGGHGERVGRHDRGFDVAQLRDLGGAGQLAEAVADVHRGRHLLAEDVARVRHDRGDAGAHVVAANQGLVADGHAGDVGDRVPVPRGQDAERDPVVAQVPVLRVRRQACGQARGQGEGGGEQAG